MLWRIIIPRTLGFRECNGRLRTVLPNPFFTEAIWLGSQLLWGNRHCFPGHAPRELARGTVIDTAPIVLFILGGLIVRIIPLLAKPASDLLNNMHHGSIPITLTTLDIKGVSEDPFFRDVARRQLADALPHPAIPTQLALCNTTTAAMGIPLLLIASILIGDTAALEAPCRLPHLRHHTAPRVEHRIGVLATGIYEVKKSSPDNGTPKRSNRKVLCSLLLADYFTINYGRIGGFTFKLVSELRQ